MDKNHHFGELSGPVVIEDLKETWLMLSLVLRGKVSSKEILLLMKSRRCHYVSGIICTQMQEIQLEWDTLAKAEAMRKHLVVRNIFPI